jgi:PilZ domain-containing protein
MTGDASKNGWFDEFKKLNSPTHESAGSTPGGRAERRRAVRFTLHDATVKLYRRGATSIFGLARLSIEGVVVNLSETGLRFDTDEKFLADTKVRLKITVAKFNDTLEADGVTRWCHTDPANAERFQVGVQFTGVDPAVARKLAQMRGWYTSAQYQALLAQQLREKKRL